MNSTNVKVRGSANILSGPLLFEMGNVHRNPNLAIPITLVDHSKTVLGPGGREDFDRKVATQKDQNLFKLGLAPLRNKKVQVLWLPFRRVPLQVGLEAVERKGPLKKGRRAWKAASRVSMKGAEKGKEHPGT